MGQHPSPTPPAPGSTQLARAQAPSTASSAGLERDASSCSKISLSNEGNDGSVICISLDPRKKEHI